MLDVDVFGAQTFELKASAFVVSYRSDIFRAQAKACAGYDGACDLTACRNEFTVEGNLAAIGWEAIDLNYGIGGVEAYANNIKHARP
jgi:hypothetical protein